MSLAYILEKVLLGMVIATFIMLAVKHDRKKRYKKREIRKHD